jgi:hypothetical protein
MKITKGMLNGLTRILKNVYPFITDIIDYKFDHSDETVYNFHNHTFYIDVDIEMLSKMTGYEIDYDYIDDHKNWSSPFWGLIAPTDEDYDLSLITNIKISPDDYISSIIESIFFRSYTNDNIDVYFNVGK